MSYFKRGDLCKLTRVDYGWNDTELLAYPDIYGKYKPLIKERSASAGMIVEVQGPWPLLYHYPVWIPELNGYSFMNPDHLQKLK